MGRQDAGPPDRDDERRRRRAAWFWRVLALLLVFCLATLCGGSAPMRTPSLDPVSTQQPVPPADVRVTAEGDRYLDVAWSAAPETALTGYNVYLDADTEPAASVAAPTTTARLTGLTNGRTYAVTVTTRTQGFLFTPYEGVRSAPASGTPRDSVPPAPPTGVSATAGDGRVDLVWTRSASTDAAAYRVVRTGPDGTTLIDVPGGAGVTAQPDTAVVNGTTYTYAVQTRDTSGNWSAPSSPAVAATPQDATAPAAPVGLTAAPGNAEVRLRWTANEEPDLASYRVLRDGVEVATVPAGTTAWLDTGLVNDRSYEYRLVAVDAVGNRSAASAPVTATPSNPSPPWDLVATPGDRRVDLTWTASSHPDVTSYVVLRDGVEVATVTGTSWTDTGLVNGVEYTFTVVAVHRAGMRSPESAPASATPHETTPPATPADLTAAPGDGQVVLSWAANGEPDLAGYELRRDGVPVDPQPGTATSHTDTGLVNGTTYTWTLVAVDVHGNRSPAATVSATPRDTTPPAAPSGFTAAPGDGQVVLTWAANGEPDLASFELRRDGVPVDPQPGTATSHTDTGL
ncbi:fibronectin type III domain-containing protein, partial [Geodermatophilus sp. YIM 151500]|uniref:fibronectin type III domain-containing protein n=1 Tax=Geodermatophilus sp. YIM 151500 TaxID=2984531 RepID=UPI0021E3C3D5